jgi:hypothetical protein
MINFGSDPPEAFIVFVKLDERMLAIQHLLEQLVRAAGREPVTCPTHLELVTRHGWDKKGKK